MSVKKLRSKLITDAVQVIEDIIGEASGKRQSALVDKEYQKMVWDALVPIIQQADNPTPLAKLTDGDITQRVDAVLSEVACGAITPDEGKKLIGLLQAGFDITELPKLIERLSDLEKT